MPKSATAPPRVRRTSLTERLKPFVDESNANELLYPNKADRPWRYIVLHHSASASGNYDQIDREHRKILGIDGCGYHFVIGNGTGSDDGQIEVAQRWNNQKQGVHCRNARTHDVDEYGIGICLVGDLDQQPPTPRQIAATQALITTSASATTSTPATCRPTPTSRPPRPFARASTSPAKRCSRDQGRAGRPARPRHLESRPRHDPATERIVSDSNRPSSRRPARYEPAGKRTPSLTLDLAPSSRRTASCKRAITLSESVISPAFEHPPGFIPLKSSHRDPLGPFRIIVTVGEFGRAEKIAKLVADRVGQVRRGHQLHSSRP